LHRCKTVLTFFILVTFLTIFNALKFLERFYYKNRWYQCNSKYYFSDNLRHLSFNHTFKIDEHGKIIIQEAQTDNTRFLGSDVILLTSRFHQLPASCLHSLIFNERSITFLNVFISPTFLHL